MEGAVREFSAHVSFSSFAAVAVARVKEELGDRRGGTGGRAASGGGGDEGGGSGARPAPSAAWKKEKNRERRDRKRQHKAESPERAKPPAGNNGGGNAGKHVGLQICWPNRPQLSAETWAAAQQAAKQHFPAHCIPWMLYPRGCSRGEACTFKHAKPNDFAAKIVNAFKE